LANTSGLRPQELFTGAKTKGGKFLNGRGAPENGKSGDKHTKKCCQCKNLYRRKGRKMQAADKRREQPTKWVPTGSGAKVLPGDTALHR